MSVNLSARQFTQPDLVEQVGEILAETGLPAHLLELEITESVLMDQTEAGTRALRALRELGVKLVLDDFGTGYSSLSYLKHLPLDTIKIDRSFVQGLESEDSNLPIVQAVISLAHGLGISVVAEGIETAGQLARLRSLECDRGQGFFYARRAAADLAPMLLAGSRRRASSGRPDAPRRAWIAIVSAATRERRSDWLLANWPWLAGARRTARLGRDVDPAVSRDLSSDAISERPVRGRSA